ncbi:hypothetical protein ACFFGT_09900 [Mucilaginibacter angelicae]|uniref:Uncharacterized protein n=1 Tax=Mucilaginibacter angelicae TaxID=869718 RepID=A0ABV6L508_9SPHI
MSKNKNIKSTYIQKNGTGTFPQAGKAGDTCWGKGSVAPGVEPALIITRHQSI